MVCAALLTARDASTTLGKNISYLERLSGQDEYDCMMLDEQYRMPPELCEWPGRYFYFDRLKSYFSETTRSQLISGFYWPQWTP